MTGLWERIDLAELSRLAGIPSALFPGVHANPELSIRQLARWARGNEVDVWLDRVRACTAREAIDLVISILNFPHVDVGIRAAVAREAWARVVDDRAHSQGRVVRAIAVMSDLSDCGANPFEADAREIENIFRVVEFPAEAPADEAGWQSVRIALTQFEDAAGNAEAMSEMRLADAEQIFDEARQQTLADVERIFTMLRPSVTHGERERSRDELRKILLPFLGPYTSPPAPPASDLTPAPSVARVATAAVPPHARLMGASRSLDANQEGRLSTFARLTYEHAPVGTEGLAGIGDLRKQEERISVMHPAERRATEWLAVAKATRDERLRAIAMGEGFFEQGEAYLRLRRKGARDFLRDSARMFARAAQGDDPRLERALLVLCVDRSHSEYSGGAQGSSFDPAIWIETPAEMFHWLERGTNLRTLALEWLELDDELADHLLSFLERRLANHEHLRGQFAGLCLMGRELRHRARRCLSRCGSLINAIGDPHLSDLWNELLDSAPEALVLPFASDETTQVFETKVRRILQYLEKADAISGIPPIPQLRETLPRLLEDGGATESARQELSADILVETLYPNERLRECAIPIVLHNPPSSAPVQDARVRLSLAPNSRTDKIRIEDDDEIVGTLLPGEDAQRWFYIDFEPSVTQERAEAVLRLEWSVGERAGRINRTIGLRPGTRAHERSPYNTGGSVIGHSFVGREKQISQIRRALVESDEPQQVLIYGIRRIGKTSLLKRVLSDPAVAARFHVVEWDSQDLPDSATTEEVAVHLCNHIVKVLPRSSRGHLDFSRERMREDPYAELERFFDAVRQGAPAKQLLLAIDEFDRLLELADLSERLSIGKERPAGPSEIFQKRFFGALRKEVMKERGVTLIVAGLPRLLHGQSYDERLFGLFRPVPVGRLSEKEAEQIISSSRVLERLHRLARARIHEATGLQPYLLQILCEQLFSRMVESGRDLVTRGDVDAVIDETMLPNESYFADYVSLIKGDEEVLWALAKVTPGLRFAAPNEVAVLLRSRGVPMTPAEVLQVLERYRSEDSDERPIVETAAGGKRDRYRFVIGLLKDYLIRRFE